MNVVVSAHSIAMDAHIIKGRLEAEGIPAYLQDDQYITMDWLLSNALGGVKVCVPSEYEEAALQVLQDTEDNDYQLSQLDDSFTPEQAESYLPEEPLLCPACHSDNISRLGWSRKISLVMLIFTHFPLPFTKRHYECNDCGKVFKPESSKYSTLSKVVITVLCILLAIIMMLTLTSPSFFQASYLERANGGDLMMTFDE